MAGLAAWFTSPLWYYGRTFFTEPYTVALAVLALAAATARRWWVASLLLGVVVVTKESAVLLVAAILAGAAARAGARQAAVLAVGPAVAGAAWVASNVARGLPPLLTSQPFTAGAPLATLSAAALSPTNRST